MPPTADKSSQKRDASNQAKPQATRETVESVVIAFVLAFLFRAFVAEAFVIPTGSMAPTLMGAHKDLFCEYCGEQYQASASDEFDANTGRLTGDATIGSICSACRGLNKYDFRGNSNHVSFSGDRILVSKFDYVLRSPQRWDVFVFKFPESARMNYIKRLVGLPGEELYIEGGDVYLRTNGDWGIARKPPGKIRAMRQIVSDTDFRAANLVEQGWPSLWQPWSPDGQASAWQIEHTADQWSATLNPTPGLSLVRYYHKVVDGRDWTNVVDGGSLPPVDPLSSQLITDFLAYNSSIKVASNWIYEKGRRLRDEIADGERAFDYVVAEYGRPSSSQDNRGHHWVGDLIGDFEIEISTETGTLSLDLVEFGVHYRCDIDVARGEATLSAAGEGAIDGVFNGESTLSSQTRIQGSGDYRIEFANVDDQLVLWVDGSVVSFSQPATFDSREYRNGSQRRPHWSEGDALDAAPIGIGGKDIGLTVTRARVHRDIYYIAPQSSDSNRKFCEYNLDRGGELLACVPDAAIRAQVDKEGAILAVYSHPEWWADNDLFGLRGTMKFQLEEEQYFPMGDNSAASSDARAWRVQNYVEEKFLLGKALIVFWPHTWNTPVPYTPNFARMGLIR